MLPYRIDDDPYFHAAPVRICKGIRELRAHCVVVEDVSRECDAELRCSNRLKHWWKCLIAVLQRLYGIAGDEGERPDLVAHPCQGCQRFGRVGARLRSPSFGRRPPWTQGDGS